ncbi:uncharacterized protein STEHIDRAFT_164724 [Stereum hirsutum FP-91666 SS1]|uniref:uncharacterized protein n=1 Tax=Stereum hirsutum (strain FP-91666) TaxID=721885 RepID=UPI000441005B|nr:uncharacterized protein STEHIDRAFT_164724 [Stereum hirsutum FP-91666 SS1]EIM92444.1 hypothetical protein STEHIDRAFT_164724 [Stereum hirsutum FP-91666 SS1]
MFLPNDGPSDVGNSQMPYPTTSSTPPPTITPALPSLTPNRRRHPHKKEPTIIEERDIFCMRCSKPMVKALLRGTRAELDAQFRPQFQCKDCAPVRQATVTSSKKRGNELEDTALPTLCVVCTKPQGEGGFVAKDRVPLMFMCEIICISCSHKYKRCSHCGGGTGRIALGKWRCKELFDGNRKTCRLSHEKLGARDMEMSVWEVPGEVQDREEYPAMVEACLNLWTDHHLSRAATPEVLEHSPDLRSWEDIHEKLINAGPPGQVLLTQPPITPYHRQYFALTWAKKQRRRDKSKPEWTRSSAKEKNIDEWVAFNTRKSNVLLPENSVLSSVWYCEWNIKDRTLMTGTLTMFDRGDVDERAGFSVSSIILRTLDEIKRHNAEMPEDIWEPPEHIWAPPRYARSHLRVKLFELIQRKCGFLPLDEYLGRHPHINPAIFGPDSGRIASHMFKRWSNIDGSGQQSVIFAKSLGTGWNAEDVKHLMQKELMKMPRGVQI